MEVVFSIIAPWSEKASIAAWGKLKMSPLLHLLTDIGLLLSKIASLFPHFYSASYIVCLQELKEQHKLLEREHAKVCDQLKMANLELTDAVSMVSRRPDGYFCRREQFTQNMLSS
jgi:hypothetical protein